MKNEQQKARDNARHREKYREQHPKANTIINDTEDRVCIFCNGKYTAIRPKRGRTTQFCSAECRRKNYEKIAHGLYKPMICLDCGKEFQRNGSGQKYCEKCKKLRDKERNRIRTEAYKTQHQLERPKVLADKTAKLKQLLPEGINLISLKDSTAKLQCSICGAYFVQSLFHLPQQVECKNCKMMINESKRKEMELEREKKKEFSNYWNNFQEDRICKHCGCNFIANRPDKYYCSEKCNRAASRKRRAEKHGSVNGKIKKRFAQDKIIDNDITVKKLFKRDNGICHICGKQCDLNDFIIKNGTTICGDNYPSIDHVIPCAKGGEHSWENVKLAHRRCNYLKSDKVGV